MIAMLVVTPLTIALVLKTRMSKIDALCSAAIGLLLGMYLDYVCGYESGMWEYTRHPYWEASYWEVLPAMWAMFGVYVVITWRKIGWFCIPLMIGLHEGYGVIRGSWHYSVDWWAVIVGWIPLIIAIVLAMNLIEAKRRPKNEVQNTQETYFRRKGVQTTE